MTQSGKRKQRLSHEKKKSLYGYGFISLWLVGFLLFFLRPMVLVVRYSLSKIEFPDVGYILRFRGLYQYKIALLEDPDILPLLFGSLRQMLQSVPIIIILSIAIAVVLNKKFFGRTLVRTIFFIPVIVASGIVISILNGDVMANTMLAGQKSSVLLQVSGLRNMMMELGLPEQIINPVITAANDIFDLLWKSGIQILLFLAALQTIPSSLFEASAIEGATEWDNFWKIKIPIISPMILTAAVYSIIDSFTDYNNQYMRKITDLATTMKIEYSSALSVINFIVISVLIGLVYLIASKTVYYNVE